MEASSHAAFAVSHNVLGQRLGRKGQNTRERILLAALRLLEEPSDKPVTLSAVAREASVGMTTLYLYFPDLGDLVLAALGRIMDEADAAFLDQLRPRWPDADLTRCSLEFLAAHLGFWRRHARVLHLRTTLADAQDARFTEYCSRVSRPLIELLVAQMGGAADAYDQRRAPLATVLLMGIERLARVVSKPGAPGVPMPGIIDEDATVDALVRAQAELLALAVRQQRALA